MRTALLAAWKAGTGEWWRWDLSGPLAELRHPVRFEGWLERLRAKRWVVYSQPPFSGPETVVRYLGCYSHRIAIRNHRPVAIDGDNVVFRYRDPRRGDRWRTLRLPALEFLRRFLQHVLPLRFVRIRHCGWLANRHREKGLELCRRLLGQCQPNESGTATTRRIELERTPTTSRCPLCGEGSLLLGLTLPRPPGIAARGPPLGAAP